MVSFDLGSYDPRRELVIDPVTDLEYSTYLGGGRGDSVTSVAVEGGDVYLAGTTGSFNFPTTAGAYDVEADFWDVFVSRISPDGRGGADLVYSTFLGGEGYDSADGFALDGDGVYVIGSTDSPDFPTTAGAFDRTPSFDPGSGPEDGFVALISPDGAGAADLVYSTFLGGDDSDGVDAIAVHGGDAYVTGVTSSSDFPTTAGAYDTSGDGVDAFVSRISPDGAGSDDLVYSTLLGGNSTDYGTGIVVDEGEVYLTGVTYATDFPTTADAFDRTYNNNSDVFLATLSVDGAGAADLTYSTYLGSRGDDDAGGIAVVGGDAYLTGTTTKTSFPTTADAYARSYRGGNFDAFVTRISPDGAGAADLVYSTFLGSPFREWGRGIAVDDGDAYVTGVTNSPRFPTTPGAFDRSFNGGFEDVFLVRLSLDEAGPAGLVYATYLGGRGYDAGAAVVVDRGRAYVGGYAGRGFPTTRGAFDRSWAKGSQDALLFIMRLRDTRFRPDGWIRHGNGRDVGDGVINPTGRRQTLTAGAHRGQQATFWITAQNDGRLKDRSRLTGPRSTQDWLIRYHRSGKDITNQVVGDGYRTPRLSAHGGRVLIKVTIRPRATAQIGSTKTVRVLLNSTNLPDRQDAVQAKVRVRRG